MPPAAACALICCESALVLAEGRSLVVSGTFGSAAAAAILVKNRVSALVLSVWYSVSKASTAHLKSLRKRQALLFRSYRSALYGSSLSPSSATWRAVSGCPDCRKYLNSSSRSFWLVGATRSICLNASSVLAVSLAAWYWVASAVHTGRLRGSPLVEACRCFTISSLGAFLSCASSARQYS